MLHNPGDLDLDDPSTLPPSERPPDLPPPMAMLSSNRAVPNHYQDHSREFSLFEVLGLHYNSLI